MTTPATSLYPFVPSGKSFVQELDFFAALGFTAHWQEDGYAGLRFGAAYFIPQDIGAPEWQKNQMIVYEVPDLDTYWEELQTKKIESAFEGARANPPKDFLWGGENHIIDLGGVC